MLKTHAHHLLRGLICLSLWSAVFFGMNKTVSAQKNPTPNLPDKQNPGQLYEQLNQQQRLRQQRIDAYCRLHNMQQISPRENRSLVAIKDVVNGRPVFYAPHNDTAARTVSTNTIWPGGSAGFNLKGTGRVIGMWEMGTARLTHREFTGRIAQRDTTAYPLMDHATHVAGTLIASGVTARAKGMAFAATLDCFDDINDISEMTNAATNGLHLSNHSYGAINGWEFDLFGTGTGWGWLGDTAFSLTEDFGFGYYDSVSRAFDVVAFNFPNYLICASAGNERDDTFPRVRFFKYMDHNHMVQTGDTLIFKPGSDGPYDCLPRGIPMAKNTLTIGAVKDIPANYAQPTDVQIVNFSSWGPTDDGRVKPDLVANGDSLFSCGSLANNDYFYFSGTSMASPNVAGSMALLQEHYMTTHAQNIASATLKAVAIHTADPPQEGVPTYKYGWGLLNAQRAAQIIQDDSLDQLRIQDLTLNNGGTYSQTVFCNGGVPLKVTIVWNDVPSGVNPEALNDRRSRLVNDLDLRLLNFQNSTFISTMVLDPQNPSAAAVMSDDTVNNVEHIIFTPVLQGFFTIRVTHKGTLVNGTQNFSLVITGASPMCSIPSVTMVNPPNQYSGSVVNIFGSGFTIPAMNPGNIVTFGSVNAVVNTGSSGINILNTTVPQGSAYVPVNVVTGSMCGYAAQSNLPFGYLFPCMAAVDTLSLRHKTDFATATSPEQVSMADLNGDGRLEMIVVNSGSDKVEVYTHISGAPNIDTTFFPPSGRYLFNSSPGALPVAVTTGDLDNDGRSDVVVVNKATNSIDIYRNTSPGGPVMNFATSFSLTTGSSPVDAAIRDVDADGKNDIVVANYASKTISVFRNVFFNATLTTGSFLTRVDFGLPSNPTQVKTGDLNGDGLPEYIIANSPATGTFDSITVLHNKAIPGFLYMGGVGIYNYQAGNDQRGLAVGDLNNDGNLDVAVTNYQSGTVSLFENTGAMGVPVLLTKVDFTGLQNPSGISIAMVDGDAYTDVLVTDEGSSTLLVYEDQVQTGTIVPGFFRMPVSFGTDSIPRSMAVGDLNNDGQPEVAVVNNYSNTASVYQNTVSPFKPVISIMMGNDTFCQGSMAMLKANPANPLWSYSWTRDNMPIGGPGSMQPVMQQGMYMVTVTDTNGCSVQSPGLRITVFPPPVVDAGPDDTTWFSTDTLVLSGHSPAGGAWSGAGVSSAGVFDPVQSGPGLHTLVYNYTDSNGCSNQDMKNVLVIDTTDADITDIDTLYSGACAARTHYIKAMLTNNGPSPLVKATIKWTVNNVAQTPYVWTGMIMPYGSAQVTIGQYAFAPGVGYNFKVWSTLPNDSIDKDPSNDTATVYKSPFGYQLGGTYTIGTSGADYTTFNNAVAAMVSYGICSAVIFDVASNTYTEQVKIPAITGASASNTITFRSAAHDNTQVTLTYGNGSADSLNFTLMLNGADYITFEDISILRSSTQAGGTPSVINLARVATYNHFTRNYIRGISSCRALVLSASGDANSFNTYTDNLLRGGNFGIYLRADTLSDLVEEEGNVIEGNTIDSAYAVCIYLGDQKDGTVRGNLLTHILSTVSGGNGSVGILMNICNSGMTVSRNKLELPKALEGISCRTCYSTSSSHTVLSNNFISIGDSTYSYSNQYFGIRLNSCGYLDVDYNSVNLVATNSQTMGRGLGCFGAAPAGAKEIHVVNNIFASEGGAYAMYVPAVTIGAIVESDYNNLYTEGSNIGLWGSNQATLSAWQSASGFDGHSHDVLPGFTSASDLHLNNVTLDGAATPLSITQDIDLDYRNYSTPDIGADEYTYVAPPMLHEQTNTVEPRIFLRAETVSAKEVKLHWDVVKGNEIGLFEVSRLNEHAQWVVLDGIPVEKTVRAAYTYLDNFLPVYDWKKLTYRIQAFDGNSSLLTTSNGATVQVTDKIVAGGQSLFDLYVHPGGGQILLVSKKQQDTPLQIRLIDLQGRVLHVQAVNGLLAANGQVLIDTSNLSAGIYLCEVRTSSGAVQVFRLIQY